jgi:DNA-binding NarL/FixJ family response regulator
MTTLVLVDDHPIVRAGIRRLLHAEGDITIVGEADEGYEAITLVEQLQPDLALVDLRLPDLNGMEVTRRIVRASPHTRVAILSMSADERHVLEALRAGAMAYIIKGASAETIRFALTEVMAGRRYLTPPLTDRVIELSASQSKRDADAMDRYDLLTNREREVLELLARGLTYAEIADKLTISPRTAETHRTNLMRKLDLTSQSDLALYAIQRGLIDPDQT